VHLLGQPEELTEKSLLAFGYGSAVHWALREWATAVGQKKEFSEKDFLAAFEWNLRNRNILTAKQQDSLLTTAHEALPLYFESRLKGQTPVLHAVEREYRAMLGDIPLKGKIDRIDRASENSADAVIIDYKTGKPKAPAAIRGGAEPGTVSRTREGDNFRQLVFYSLLLEQAEPLLVPQAFALEFIGERGDEPVCRQFQVTEQEKNDLRALVGAVWAKIQALDFTKL
jgi:hypothetical protein